MKILLSITLCAAAALAQNFTLPPAAPPTPPPAPAPTTTSTPTPLKIGGVTFSGSFRTRVQGWDWFQPSSGDNSYAFSESILKFGFSQNRETWDWNAEFAVPFLLGLPSNATGPGAQGALGFGANYFTANTREQNAAMIFPKQLYVRFTQFGNSRASMLKVGRFEFSDGSEVAPKNATLATVKSARVNQRLLGPFGFADVGRSFDGVHYAYNKPSGNFTFVGAVPTRGVFQVDGWGWNKAAFGYASYTRPWARGRHTAETRIFALYYDDWRPILKTDDRPTAVRRGDLANIRVQTYGGHTLHAFATSAGTIDVLAWGAAQTGRWGVQDQRAYAFDIEGGYQPAILPKLKPWVRGGYYAGSGDHNPNDNSHGTFFQVLPTPRPFAKTPFFNMMNNQDRFGMLTLRPHARVTVISEFHALRLADRNDLWYSGGGVFQPWTFGYTGRAGSGQRSLANLYDTGVDFKLNSRITLSPYFGYMQGRAVIAAIYPKGTDGKFGYMELQYRF